MKNLNLKLSGVNSKFVPSIIIDGEYVKCKKNEFGSYEANYKTEKEEVEITILRDLELKGKFWWFYAIISFIVSIFGIFEPPYDRKNIVIDCRYKIKLTENNDLKIVFNNLSKQGKAVEIETKNEVEEIKNEFYIDKQTKKRWLVLLIAKIIAWIAILIVAIILIRKYIKY